MLLSNPYNTRNTLGHEKEHLWQNIKRIHSDLGKTKVDRKANERGAIKVQRTLPSWNKTTERYKKGIKRYEKKNS